MKASPLLRLMTALIACFAGSTSHVNASEAGDSNSEGPSPVPTTHTLQRTPPYRQPSLPTLLPRFTLIEAGYPQLLSASVGVWIVMVPVSGQHDAGVVGDFRLGLSGATAAVGIGANSLRTASKEKVSSFGLEGLIHRTWPWWSPWLHTSATYAGVEAFGHLFAFRCSVGIMWNIVGDESHSSPFATGGCGLGLP